MVCRIILFRYAYEYNDSMPKGCGRTLHFCLFVVARHFHQKWRWLITNYVLENKLSMLTLANRSTQSCKSDMCAFYFRDTTQNSLYSRLASKWSHGCTKTCILENLANNLHRPSRAVCVWGGNGISCLS